MARKVRIQYPGAIYHVMNRGDRREPIFEDDHDRQRLLETLGEACEKTAWRLHAYCLMPNHFHLVVETPQPNLVDGMKWLLGTYTGRYNRRHREFGHLFSGRYKALVVDGSGNGYLKTVCDYVHLNPARARLLRPEQPLSDFLWSSYPGYLAQPRTSGLAVAAASPAPVPIPHAARALGVVTISLTEPCYRRHEQVVAVMQRQAAGTKPGAERIGSVELRPWQR